MFRPICPAGTRSGQNIISHSPTRNRIDVRLQEFRRVILSLALSTLDCCIWWPPREGLTLTIINNIIFLGG